MEAKAIAKYLKGGPQKARLVIDQIRGKRVGEALSILSLSTKAVSRDIMKLVKSAVANAENNNNMDVDALYVKRAFVDRGPSMKRMHSRAQGRGTVIKKRSAHITVVLDEKESVKAAKAAKAKAKEAKKEAKKETKKTEKAKK
jgi:large subunit ribosomal protein L22